MIPHYQNIFKKKVTALQLMRIAKMSDGDRVPEAEGDNEPTQENTELKTKSGNKRSELLMNLRKRSTFPAFNSLRHNDHGVANKRRARNMLNASKSTRKIEFGWSTYCQSESRFKQVRKPNGGGTRESEVPKTFMKEKLMDIAKSYFFPSGVSLYGNTKECYFDISLDPNGLQIIPPDETVEATFQRTRLRPLKYYLLSHSKANDFQSDSDDIDVALPVMDSKTSVRRSKRKRNQPTSPKQDTLLSVPDSLPDHSESVPDHSESVPDSLLDHSDVVPETSNSDTTRNIAECPTSNENLVVGNESEDFLRDIFKAPCFDIDDEISVGAYSPEATVLEINNLDSTIRDEIGVDKITVHRGRIFEDLLNYLKANRICNRKLEIIMILPNGQQEAGEDNGGVFRDALSEFWQTFYCKCTVGESIRVPTIIHTMTAEEWQAVASVFLLGYQQEGYFPVKLATPFLQYILSGEKSLDANELTAAFMQYIPEIERQTLAEALENFDSVDKDDLLDVLGCHDVRICASSINISKIVQDIAHKELIQAPAYIAECWAPILRKGLCHLIGAIKDISNKLVPNVKAVLSMLVIPDDLNGEQKDTINYLRRFIKGMEASKLESFLRFCTGSNLLVKDKICVSFFKPHSEFTRSPLAHTCGCLLELPYDYTTFVDFRHEFDSILDSNIWVMDFI